MHNKETDGSKNPGQVGKFPGANGFSGEIMVLPEDLDQLPTQGVSSFVRKFAAFHGVKYQRTAIDQWAEAVSRVHGDDVQLDDTGKLLVALKKKKIIKGQQMARLLSNHLRELNGLSR